MSNSENLVEIEEPLTDPVRIQSTVLGNVQNKALDFTRRFWDNYVCLAVMAAFSIALSQAISKVLTKEYSAFQVLSLRSVVCALVFGMESYRHRIPLFGPQGKAKILSLRGIIGGGALSAFYLATELLPVTEAAFLSNTFSTIVAFTSWMLRMEKLNWISWLGVLGTVVGAALIARPPFLFGGEDNEWDAERAGGILSACVSSILLAGVCLVVNKIGSSVPSITVSFYQSCYNFIEVTPILFIYYIIPSFPVHWRMIDSIPDGLLFLAFSAASLCQQWFMNKALQIGPATKTSMLLLTENLFASAFGFIAFTEPMNWILLLGCFVTFISLVAITSQKHD